MRSRPSRLAEGLLLGAVLLVVQGAWATSRIAGNTGSGRRIGPYPPPWVPSFEEHSARAAGWAREHAGSGRTASAAEPGLVDWKRIEFPPAFYPEAGLRSIGAGVVAGLSYDGVLATLDAGRGQVEGALTSHLNTWSFDAAIGPNGPRALITGSNWRSEKQGFTIVDLTDPAHPVAVAGGEPCTERGIVLPGGRLGFVWGAQCSFLISMDDGRRVQDFSRPVKWAYGGLLDGAPILLVHRPGDSYNDPAVLEAWWLADPAVPQLKWFLPTSPYAGVWLDSPGAIVAISGDTDVSIFDLRTGTRLSELTSTRSPWAAEFVDAEGTRALALAYDGFVELLDLTDSATPRLVGVVAAQTQSTLGGWAQADRPLLAHADRPWLAIATTDPPGFEVVDARDASVVASYTVDHSRPSAIAWIDLADGTPAVVWHGYWFDWPDRHADGGTDTTDTVALNPASGAQRVARYASANPRDIDRVVPVAGRYAATTDLAGNSIALVDTATGTAVDAFGFSQPVYGGCWWDSPIIASMVSTFVVGDGCAAEIVSVSEGKLIRRGGIAPPSEYALFSDVAVTPDGTVVSLWPTDGVLLASHPDGRVERLDLGSSSLAKMELDGSGRRAVLTSGDVWADATSPMVVVATDAPGLRILWSNEVGAVFATFVHDDTAVAATVQQAYRYGPRLFDASSGAPLATTGDMADAFFYFGPGVRFGRGSAERLVYWNWTWLAWSSAVFDISEDKAVLLGVSEEYVGNPQQLSRDDDRTAFEVRFDETRIVTSDGGFPPAGGDRGNALRKLRHGFWTAFADAPIRDHRTVLLLRDPEVNRAPVADPGPDRTLECAAPAGTPAHLDGRGSTDLDSSPGTQDDISAYAWTVGGASVGTGPEADVVLPLGTSVARLEVTDALRLTSAKDAALRVSDTTPPVVTLALTPYLPPSRMWSHQWTLTTAAQDVCDGALPAPALLPLARDVLSAPVAWTASALSAVEVLRGGAGLLIRLLGPREDQVRAQWSAAVGAGGLVASSDPITLVTSDDAPRGSPRGLIARYDLTDRGTLSAAAAYGAGADIPFTASAVDSTGNVASMSITVRQTLAHLCASVPDGVTCFSPNAVSTGRSCPSPQLHPR